jgi:hypothetical protein
MRPAAERVQMIQGQREATDVTQKLYIRDRWRNLPVWRVPVDALALNVDNRRFRAERLLAEEQLGRTLDPENNPDDELSIESLLLDTQHRAEGGRIVGTRAAASEALEADWVQRGQESALWIRPDGTIRNGNRRLAMIKRRQREYGAQGLEWVQVVILTPEEVDERTLLEMEQREQLTENLKVRYNDIDYLLALREAADLRGIDWYEANSIDRVAGELQTMAEKTKSEVLRDLYAIRYMDAFLETSNQAGQYHKLLRTLERFRDIGRMMVQVESEYPDDAAIVLEVLFAAVRSGVTHGDIRKIRAMFRRDRQRFDVLSEQVRIAEESVTVGDGAPPLESPAAIEENAEDAEDVDDGMREGPGPHVPNYPRAEVTTAFQVAIDGFEAGQQTNTLQVLLQVQNRLNALRAGNRLQQALDTNAPEAGQIRAAARDIIRWADEARGFLEWVKPKTGRKGL